MPRPALWHFSLIGNTPREGVYICLGTQVLSKYGCITGIRSSPKDGEDCIKVAFNSCDKIKMLKLEHFAWDKNDFSTRFKGCQSPEAFIQIFNNANATYDDNVESADTVTDDTSPPAKRQKITPLIPASHSARELETKEQDEFDIKTMDKAIHAYFQGYFVLPVKCLKAPPNEWLVRDCSEKVVEQLKLEMIANNCTDVQPILCIADVKGGDSFDACSKEGYRYATIGGNHSRQALQELIKEKPAFANNRQYSHRLCAVYTPMDTKLIRRLASKHNRAAAYCHEMTTWDWVVQCRKLLYELSEAQDDQEPPSNRPDGWKKACSSILALTVAQLDERMIFFLASLPKATFDVVSGIFKTFSEGKLKDQTIPRSKKGIKSSPELKGSTFKAFRGLDSSTIHRLLTDVLNRDLSIKEATTQCADIKALQKIQQGFLCVMNMGSWDEAKETYPHHTTPEKLEPFKHLDFSGRQLPQQFLQFCQQIRTGKRSDHDSSTTAEDHDNVFVLKSATTAVLWKADITAITVDSFEETFNRAGVKCMGFSLALLDYSHSSQIDIDKMSQEIKHSTRVVRGINYSIGRQDFVVNVFCQLHYLGILRDVLSDVFDKTQLAICALPQKKKDTASTAKNLDEVTIGLVVGQVGTPPALPKEHGNYFLHPMDQWYYDSATSKPVFEGQKPIALITELVELYTTPKDWVFSSPSEIGTSVIAGLKNERNVLCIERHSLNFIHSKIRATGKLSSVSEETEEGIAENNDNLASIDK